MKKLTEELEFFEEKQQRLTKELADNTIALKNIKIEIFKRKTGFNVNDDVVVTSLSKKMKGKIVDFVVQYNNTTPKIQLYKKNGDLGKRFLEWYRHNDSIEKLKDSTDEKR